MLIFAIILFSAIGSILNPTCPKCECPAYPKCNYSGYENNLTNCNQTIENLTNELRDRPIQYILNTTYINNTIFVDRPVYLETTPKTSITLLIFWLSLFLTIKLFTIKINLPKELEEKVEKIEKAILIGRWVSFALTILIMVRLLFILIKI